MMRFTYQLLRQVGSIIPISVMRKLRFTNRHTATKWQLGFKHKAVDSPRTTPHSYNPPHLPAGLGILWPLCLLHISSVLPTNPSHHFLFFLFSYIFFLTAFLLKTTTTRTPNHTLVVSDGIKNSSKSKFFQEKIQ